MSVKSDLEYIQAQTEIALLKTQLEELRKFTNEIPVKLFLDYLQEKIDYHKGRMLSDSDTNQWWLETGAFEAVQDIFTDVITGKWAVKT